MTARRIAYAIGAVALLAVTALVVAAFLIPSDRIAAALAARAEAALGQPVAIDRVSLDLLPRPAAALSGLRIGPEDAPVAVIGGVRVQPRLLPLLAGRVVVDRVAITSPRLAIVMDSAGRPNLGMPRDTMAAAAAPAAARDIDFAIRRLTISDGVIGFLDERDGTALRLDGYNQSLALAGALEGGELRRIALEGRIAVDSLSVDAPAALAVPVHGLRIVMRHDAELDRTTDVLTVRSLGLEVQELSLEGSGRVTGLDDPGTRRLELQLATQPFDPVALLQSVPAAMALLPAGALPDIRGTTTLSATVSGPLSADTLPNVDGALHLDGVAVAWKGTPLLDGLGGDIAFSMDSVAATGLEGTLLGAPFRLAFAARQPAAPLVTFSTTGTLALGRLAGLAPLPEGMTLDGATDFDVSGRSQPLDPATTRLQGSVRFRELSITTPRLRQTVSVPAGRLELAGEELRLRDLVATFGDSRLAADANVRGWLPMALGEVAPPPEASFDVRAGTLDLDALLGPSESAYPAILFARLRDRPIDGRSAEDAAREAGLGLPALPPVIATGRLRADRMVRNEMDYSNVDVRLVLGPDRAEVTSARLGLMGGTVELGATLTPSADGATLALRYDLTDVGAGPFFDTLTPFKDHLAGMLGLAGTGRLELDSLMLPVRTSLVADGDLSVTDGHLANWDVLRAVGNRMELARFDTLQFNDWTGRYNIVGPLVTLDETVLSGGEVNITAAGAFDLGGRLDLGATFRLERRLAERAGPAIRQLAAAAAGGSSTIPVGISIRGPVESPEIGLDLSAARDNLAQQAREAAREQARRVAAQAEAEARRQAERLAGQAAERILPDSVHVPPLDSLEGLSPDSLRALYGDSIAAALGDSLAARADSVKKAVADSLRNRLRRIIPPAGEEP